MYGGYIYIITNYKNTTLYTGVTSNLIARIIEHRDKLYPKSFSSKYQLNKLVYFESFDSIEAAIQREKQIKGGSRKKKNDLIDSMNPEWRDLFDEIQDMT
jgi:putative endonuclease